MAPAPPRPRFRDHLRVAWLLVQTLFALLPVLVWIPLSPVLKPLVRAMWRRRLGGASVTPEEPPPPDAADWDERTIFLVAGEASGDRLAAPVVAALLRRCPGIVVRGYAGPACAASGAHLDRDIVGHAVVGVIPVLKSIGFWWRLCAETLARLREEPPDVFLTVDFPGLNARLARWARKRGVATVHLVAPAVWAYLPWRIWRWRRGLDHLLTTFPFEAVLFAESGIPSTFVGHPLFEAPLPAPRTTTAWPGAGPCRIELLPGSREQEIRAHAPLLLEAAAVVGDRIEGAHFLVRPAEAAHAALFERAAQGALRSPARLEVRTTADDAPGDPPLLGAIASSGTVTAELGAACVPMAIVYRVSWVARVAAWISLTAPYFGLANLVAGREVVPERVQVSGRGAKVADDFFRIAGTEDAWTSTRADLETLVRGRIAVADVADRASRAVLHSASAILSRRASS